MKLIGMLEMMLVLAAAEVLLRSIDDMESILGE